ncbi:MAG: hypothetical protein R3Y11_09595 [Pseudomonadota bacterium]
MRTCIICGRSFRLSFWGSRKHCGDAECLAAYEEREEVKRVQRREHILKRSQAAAARRAQAEEALHKPCPVCGKLAQVTVFRHGICSFECKLEYVRRRFSVSKGEAG